MAWITSDVRTLSLTQNGSRLVQQAFSVAQPYDRDLLADGLLEDPVELLCSPHANHVLAKLISVLPAPRLGRLWEALRGEATTLARHQFGSRILERLIEHCSEDQIGFLLDELTADLEALARHQFGNFVVQRTLEHCTATRRHTCVEQLLPHVLKHATHKTASNVVVCLQAHSDLDGQAAIADAFLAGKGEVSLENIAATRYGSFVVHNLVDRFHPRIDAVKARVKAAHQQLQESGYSRQKIVNFLGEAFFRD
jgi:pumilio RNA-binding family